MNFLTTVETVPFEPWWVAPISEQLEDILDDRDMTTEHLANLTGIALSDLQAFLNQETAELSSAQYLAIETSLNLPINYFAGLKIMYEERTKKLNAERLTKTA